MICLEATNVRELEQTAAGMLEGLARDWGITTSELDVRMAQSHNEMSTQLTIWVTRK